MKRFKLIGASNVKNVLSLSLLVAIATSLATDAISQVAGADTVKLLSQPIAIPSTTDFQSSALDEIVDVVYALDSGVGLPTTRRFSELYSDALYDPKRVVMRLNYPEEERALALAGRQLFEKWNREVHRAGGSKWLRADFATGLGDCIRDASSSNARYHSTIRLYDRALSFDCIYKRLSSRIDEARLKWFFRETEHSNALLIHGAQERFLSSFVERRRHSFRVLTSSEFQLRIPSGLIDVTYDRVQVRRDWLDEIYWNVTESGTSSYLRNEFHFNGDGDETQTGQLCFVRELSLVCKVQPNEKVCRVENARCDRMTKRMVQ